MKRADEIYEEVVERAALIARKFTDADFSTAQNVGLFIAVFLAAFAIIVGTRWCINHINSRIDAAKRTCPAKTVGQTPEQRIARQKENLSRSFADLRRRL
ncbi:MAG: hypothetical protein AAF393_05380 [Pseudomonadota bacterium]